MFCFAQLLYHEQDVANVHADGALRLRFVKDVAAHGFPVAVEGQSQELAFGVEHGAARIAARDVVVGDEAYFHFALLIGITAEVAGRKQGEDFGLYCEIHIAGMRPDFLLNAFHGGIVTVFRPVERSIATDSAEAEAHGGVEDK